ncbi:hypothetical protein E5288_WYG005325 [Bos mutus]|uniref:Uncharacterized protein n=1 Tax=Bos mutus TaxID=72004 RepID=A0A6B0SAY9_9CETA|nr:hypothetical protein [Bos mutus]
MWSGIMANVFSLLEPEPAQPMQKRCKAEAQPLNNNQKLSLKRNIQALNSMVWALPFPCLPLGILMNDHQPHLETFQAALDGLGVHLLRRSDPVPKNRPAEGPGPQWCQPDQPQLGAPAGSDREDLSHPAGPGPGRVKHHGHPVQCPPALPECCSQLTTFSFCGNPISMAVLESLLHHTMELSKLSHVLYPAALESYEDMCSTLHLGLLAQLHARVKQLLCESGRLSVVWFSTNPCPHCSDQIFYDIEPILCPCYMPA